MPRVCANLLLHTANSGRACHSRSSLEQQWATYSAFASANADTNFVFFKFTPETSFYLMFVSCNIGEVIRIVGALVAAYSRLR